MKSNAAKNVAVVADPIVSKSTEKASAKSRAPKAKAAEKAPVKEKAVKAVKEKKAPIVKAPKAETTPAKAPKAVTATPAKAKKEPKVKAAPKATKVETPKAKDTVAKTKRSPGRPPKVVAAVEVAASTAKRGPGRPRKVATAEAPLPQAIAASTVKRGPGRPPKAKVIAEVTVQAPVKRGPGRPKKVLPIDAGVSLGKTGQKVLAKINKAAVAAAPKTETKVKAPKAVKKEPIAKKVEPKAQHHYGQKGPPMELPHDKLNANERALITALHGKGHGRPAVFGLKELASTAFPSLDAKKANSWTRNSLRRLVRGGWVSQASGGHYAITLEGRHRLLLVARAEQAAATQRASNGATSVAKRTTRRKVAVAA